MKLLVGYSGLLLIVRLALCAVFLMAALPKLQNAAAFAVDIAAYQVTGPALSAWASILLPWTELACAIGLLTPWTRRASGLVLCILLCVFICLHSYAWSQGLDVACGCFGKEAEDIATNYPWLLIRNLLLLAGCGMLLLKDLRNNTAGHWH